jgi:hypothetical protein
MRFLFIVIVFLHGLIHLLGFVKAFGLMEIKELASPISKPVGAVWLMVTAVFLIYGFLAFINNKHAWLIGLIAVSLSQVLIISVWKDAKFGTIPNVILAIAVLFSYGNSVFDALVKKEKSEILSKSENQVADDFSEKDIENLPPPVKKWLVNTGAIGHQKTINGKIIQKALMKMKPDQANWDRATAVQYTVINEPSFIWTVDLQKNRFMWFKGRDKFQNGKGEMLIKMNSLISVVDEAGEKIDEGSIQRYVGEMVWFPYLAVSPYIQWENIDELSAKATMTYHNTKGSGTFYFNEKGDFVKFVALRFQSNERDANRKEWTLKVEGYQVFEGIKVPSKMNATWKLDTGDWTWLELEILDIQYNVN